MFDYSSPSPKTRSTSALEVSIQARAQEKAQILQVAGYKLEASREPKGASRGLLGRLLASLGLF